MSWLEIIAIALGLAMDALAVSIAAGLVLPEVTRRHVFRVAFHFGLFQFMMPPLGWALGTTVVSYVETVDHWIAFGLLAFIGGKMIWDAVRGDGDTFTKDPTRGILLVSLAVATSIDALAVGLSMGLLEVPWLVPSVVIGIVAAGLSWAGITVGRSLGERWRARAAIGGGIVLVFIGVRIVITHLAA